MVLQTLVPRAPNRATTVTFPAVSQIERFVAWFLDESGDTMDSHLVTTSFEDRPWLNDMDKKTPIQIAAEARLTPSTQCRQKQNPRPVPPVALRKHAAGAHRSQKTADAKLRDQGAPGCSLSDESLQAFRSKHGYNNYDPDADKFYACKRGQKRSWPVGAPPCHALPVVEVGCLGPNMACFTPCRLSIAAAGRPQASCLGRRPSRPASERCGH